MNVQTSIRPDKTELLRQAREEAYATPLEEFHPGAPRLFQDDTLWPWFERLRKEAPVHYCTNAPIEPYWSVTRYSDIMHVDTNHGTFSSEAGLGGITIHDLPPGYDWPSFITMDQPKHAPQRKTVAPMFTPAHLDELAMLIRRRSAKVLDELPRNETFNFVERVSIELTTQMLATLFDFPFEERRKLTRWSDVSTALPKSGIVESPEQRFKEMEECRVLAKLPVLVGILIQRQHRAGHGIAGGVVAADDEQDDVAHEVFTVHMTGGLAMGHHGDEVVAGFGVGALVPEPRKIVAAFVHLPAALFRRVEDAALGQGGGDIGPAGQLLSFLEREIEQGRQHLRRELDRHTLDEIEGLVARQVVEHLRRALADQDRELVQMRRREHR